MKDARVQSDRKQGVYGGFQSWVIAPAVSARLGDGQVNFGAIFSKLTQYGFAGWAVLEWECCLKSPRTGRARRRSLHQARISSRRPAAPLMISPPQESIKPPIARCWASIRPTKVIGATHAMTSQSANPKTPQRLRLGMVGGGPGSFIGAVHRIAARLDDRFELVAGALPLDATARARLRRSNCIIAPRPRLCRVHRDGRRRKRQRH